MTKTFNITVLPGDGIGPEVIEQAIRVLDTVSAGSSGVKFNLASHDFGGCAIDKHGNPLPDATLEACKSADAVLMGSVGGPKWGVGKVRPEQGLLRLRKELGLYANIRPANFASDSLVASSPLKDDVARGVDFIVVRELIGGLYFGKRKEEDENMPSAKGLTSLGDKSIGDPGVAWDTMVYSVEEVKRITRVAAQIALAADPPLKIHSVDKANVLASSRLWRRVVSETIKDEYPQLELDHGLVDSVAMVMVQSPRKLNGVILTENLFGDILSDEASVIPGSLGLLPSASLAGPPSKVTDKTTFGLYEPIHGSAPDIAGQGIANPVGTILSAAMMLRYSLGQRAGSSTRESASREMTLPVATLTSSLDIAVDGATPIGEDQDPLATVAAPAAPPAQTPTYESKRAPRKSKTDAMAAINQRSTSPDSGRSKPPPGPAPTNPVNIPTPKLNLRFDLGSVKTRAKTSFPARTAPRLMDLDECPVFRPTLDEFRDPIAYVRSIHERAVGYGIIKIVPPVEWEMPFVCDTETFRFKTRLQRLNSIEASSRAKMSFLEQLYRYHEQGASKVSVPMINHQPLDLWLLRREVQRRGGYDVVSRNKLWGDVQRAMGYTGPSVLAAQLKAAYTRIISPYEFHRAQVRHEALPSQSRRVQPSRTRARQSTRRSNSVFPSSAATPPSSPLTPSSSPLSEPPDDADPQAAAATANGQDLKLRGPSDEGANAFSKALAQDPGPSMTFDNTPIPPLAEQIAAEVRKGETCEICRKSDRDTEMLLCDGCDEGFHMFCLDPPLHA
ncbi:3-isopropylmalate dehydrogenase, partial [Ceratobasidium sp. 394]